MIDSSDVICSLGSVTSVCDYESELETGLREVLQSQSHEQSTVNMSENNNDDG